MFVQDSWKATRKLTIDYGLRWDYATPASEEYGRSANLSLTTPNPAAGGHPGAPIFEATCKCQFVQAYPYAVGPRLGIAYAVNSKTVVRGGWGLAFAAPPDINLQNTANLTNTAVGVNAYNPINAPGTIPQPAWPNFSVGQTPLRARPPAASLLIWTPALPVPRARISGASAFSVRSRRIL